MRRFALAPLVFLAAFGCTDAEGGGPRSWFSRGEGRTLTVSAGDAELGADGRLNFEITSDVYRRWLAARRALGRSETARFVADLGRRGLSQDELDAAVARVERDAEARAAIEGAGMTPLEYVYATVAIEQAMAVASGRFSPRARDEGRPQEDAGLAAQYPPGMVDTSVIVMPEAPPAPYPAPTPHETVPPTPLPPAGPPVIPPPPQADPETLPPQAPPAPRPTPLPAPTPPADTQPQPQPQPQPQAPPSVPQSPPASAPPTSPPTADPAAPPAGG